jgi:hypothetical protein
LNSFERFDAVLDLKKPDKLPLFIPTISCSVASKILGYPAHTGGESIHFKEQKARFEGEEAFNAFEVQYFRDTFAIAEALRVDVVRNTWRRTATPTAMPDEYTLEYTHHGKTRIEKFFPETESFGCLRDDNMDGDPDALIRQIEKNLEDMNEGEAETPEFDAAMRRNQKAPLTIKAMAAGKYPALAPGPGFGFAANHTAGLQALVLYPDILAEYFRLQALAAAPYIRWMAKQGFRLLSGGLDLAGPQGLVFSPKIFEKVLAPAYKIVSDECRKNGVTYAFGSDGNYKSISDLLYKDIGIAASVETEEAAGMTVGFLRKNYPDLIVIGAINSTTLHLGSVTDVRKEVRRSLDESEGVQYIPGPSNSVMHGTPPENLFAMIDEIEKGV